jgi:NAD+ diphosphatase
MLGCIADAESDAIQIDPAESEAARGFSREQIAAALAGGPDEPHLPPALSIAHQLLRAWLEGSLR